MRRHVDLITHVHDLVHYNKSQLLVDLRLDGVGEAWVRPDGLPLRSAVQVRDGHAVWAARVLLAEGRAVRVLRLEWW
jgi:hypothetical protein